MRWSVVHIASGYLPVHSLGTPSPELRQQWNTTLLFFPFLPKLVDGSGVHSTPSARRGIECECPPFLSLYVLSTHNWGLTHRVEHLGIQDGVLH